MSVENVYVDYEFIALCQNKTIDYNGNDYVLEIFLQVYEKSGSRSLISIITRKTHTPSLTQNHWVTTCRETYFLGKRTIFKKKCGINSHNKTNRNHVQCIYA